MKPVPAPRSARLPGTGVLAALAILCLCVPGAASAATGFGELSGPGGCLANPGKGGGGQCAAVATIDPQAVAVSPDGTNVYVVGGVSGPDIAESFGAIDILRRNPATGEVNQVGCLSSDGTGGLGSAGCTPTPSLLGADGVTVSADGKTVFVASNASASLVAFARDPETGKLTRLGCLQMTPFPRSPCTAADLFRGSDDLLTSPDGSALYVASPLEGTISSLMAAAGAGGTPPSVASLFTAIPGPFTNNPCIAVNGYDGSCSVGVAMKGIRSLTLSPDGRQLYGVAGASAALDVFAQEGGEALVQTGCLTGAPGVCTEGRMLVKPTGLAMSPDGRNIYIADTYREGGKIDVLSRDPSTGALKDSSCVDFLPEPRSPSEDAEDPERAKEDAEEEKLEKARDEEQEKGFGVRCNRVPGLDNVQMLAVSGDGSAVYAFGSNNGDGSSSVVSFDRDPSTGALTETACASESDPRCAHLKEMEGIQAAAVSPDGHDVYVATADGKALVVFGVGASLTSATASATRSGLAFVSLACPSQLNRPCRGQMALTRLTLRRRERRRRLIPVNAGRSRTFTIGPGRRAVVAVHLNGSTRSLLLRRHGLRVTGTVVADPSGGGSGLGQALVLRLVR